MNKILIITDYFAPYGGPRINYLADFLTRNSWDVYVVTIDQVNDDTSPTKSKISNNNVFRVKEKYIEKYSFFSLRRIKDYINFIISSEKSHEGRLREDMIDAVLNEFNGIIFSFIIASYGTKDSVISAASQLSKILNVPWAADLRDILEQDQYFDELISTQLRIILLIRRRNSLLKSATFITTISKWHVNYLSKKFPSRVNLVYNGYDPLLFSPDSPPRKTNIFKIIYAGSLWAGRDLNIILKSLDKLFVEKEIDIDNISIDVYGRISNNNYLATLNDYKSANCITAFHSIEHDKIPDLLREASLLIVLVKSKTKGIMTTKAFEYIASRRPVLSFPKADGSLTEILIQTQSGDSADTVEEVSQMILKLYKEWKENGVVENRPSNQFVKEYSREFQSAKLNELILKNLKT